MKLKRKLQKSKGNVLSEKSGIAAFDLDRTIIAGNCSYDFCRYLIAKDVLPFSSLAYSLFYYVKHIFFGMNLSDLHDKIFEHLLKGRSLERIAENVEPFLQDYLFSRIYPPALSELRLAQHLGHYTLILSNSPHFLVEKIAHLLGVDEWRATQYAVDKEHNLCHITSIMQGEEKASCVQEIARRLSIAKEKITAYSDSFSDLPLLMTAGIPIAVNPDRKLRRFSKRHQWLIL
jgi:HAD superfamily hydrolase (TIGR01490 family)